MYCTVKLGEAVKPAIDARESSWKWAHLSIPIVDGELGKLVLAKARWFRETKCRENCVLVKCMVTGSTISTGYSRIK